MSCVLFDATWFSLLTVWASLLTTDIITEFAFAKSANLIEEKSNDLDSWFLDAFDVASQSVVDLQYNALLRQLVKVLPISAVEFLSPKLGSILNLQKVYRESPSLLNQ